MEVFPMGTQHRKQREKQVYDAMYAPIDAAGTQRCRDVVVLDERGLDAGIVATKEQGSDYSDRHDLGVGEVTLRIVPMVQRFKHVSTNALHCYHVDVHEEGLLKRKFEHRTSSAFFMDLAR
jgi:hypothetical protein